MNHSAEPSPVEAPEEFDGWMGLVCLVLALSFTVGAPGNLLVIWTILRHVKQNAHVVVLILHLAAADLLVLVTLPLWIYSLMDTWVFGAAFCKALVYIINVCMFSSIFFITLMSVERFLAICHPFVMLRWKNSRTLNWCLVVLWLAALLSGVPVLLTQTLDGFDGTEQCLYIEFTSVTHAIIHLCLQTSVGFVIPFITLSICYCRVSAQLNNMSFNSKPKSMALILAVVVGFTLCWFPYHLVNIIDLACTLRSGVEHQCVPSNLVSCSGALVFISSAVNPMLYAFFARNLRGSLVESPLVRLFQDMAVHTSRLNELSLPQQASQRAADTQEEQVAVCLIKIVNP
ncbi:leukotriene B4 receptor 1-like [Salarias fasciatus]|uniref:Leukotriene B4 receptor 1-like n=1 Tax=Salarias fasciatus TaxID=181472 RepID=A0A672F9I9_SALFA|nr:leukotriene B4 receptor 1-like [Salarias fasciatus]